MSLSIIAIVSLLIAISAIYMVRVKDLFALVVLMAIYSLLLAVLFAVFGAVDVAFTEAVVGTGVSTVFLMALLWHVDPNELTRGVLARRVAAGVVALALGAVLLYGVHALPPFGATDSPASEHIAPYYIANSVEDMATPNVVTAVLADYRSLDTLIEAAVVVTAALACLLVMSRNNDPTL
ncbi:MAG: DUF4040 domain-containing protein [Phycisphaeraceae bacterium]